LIVPLPDSVSFEAGCSATVGAIALQGVRLARPRLGDRIVVIGLGLIGNLCAQLCRASGARVFGIDLAQDKVELATATGCHSGTWDSATAVEQVLAFTDGHGADAVLIAASAQGNDGPMKSAVEMSRLRGTIVAVGNVGMGVPRDDAYRKELTITASMSYGPGRYDSRYEERGEDYPFAYVRYTEQRNMAAYLDAVEDGAVDIETLLTHRFPIGDALSAYELITKNTEPYVGVLLTYGDADDPELVPAAHPKPAPAPAPTTAGYDRVSRTIGIGVVGAGLHARSQLLPALKTLDVRAVGVVNRTGASADQAKAIGGFDWADTQFERLLEDRNVDAIIIGTRHRLHAAQIIAAFQAGKHVFVEKPLCLTEDELTQIAEAQSTHGRYVQVGTNRRFSPYTTALKDLFSIRADPLALNVRVNAGALPADHWLRDASEGGGRLVGEGVHWVDWCQAVVDRPIQTVSAQVSRGGPTALPSDTWTATLTFGDGSLAQIQYAAEGSRAAPKERLEVVGLGKLAVINDWASGTVFDSTGSHRLKAPRGQQKGIPEQLAAFVRSLRTGKPAVSLDTTWHVQHSVLVLNQTTTTGVAADVACPTPA